MPKESTIQHYTSSTTGNAPAGVDLASGELAINTADEKIFYKNHVGTVLSLSQTKDLSGAFAPRSGVVTSVNGATGNIVSIATTGSNVFTGLQTMNAGLTTSHLYVSGGATFSGSTLTFQGTNAKTIQSTEAPLTIKGVTSGPTLGGYNGVVLGVQTNDPLRLYSATNVVDVLSGDETNPTITSIRLNTNGGEFGEAPATVTIGPSTYLTASRTINIPDASGTLALTGANTFSGLQTMNAGISGTLTGSSALFPIANDNTTNAQRFLLFAGGAGYTSINIDATTPRVTYNPSTGTLRTSVLEIGQPTPGLTMNTNGEFACNNGFAFGNVGGLATPGSIYFLSTSEIFFGDVGGEAHGASLGMIGAEGRLFFGTTNQMGSLAINRANTGLTFAAELNHATGKNLRLVYNDTSSISPTGAVEFTTNSSGDLTIKPSGGDVTISGSLTVTGNATFDGNTTIGNAATDTTTIYGTKIVNEGVYANGSLRTANISFANGQVQTLTGVGTGATGATAIYFTNAPSSGAASVTLIVTNGGLMSGTGMTAWGGNIKWPGGIKSVLTSSGIDVVSFVTPDAGSTIYGFVGGLNFT